jgi:hypothetical protein
VTNWEYLAGELIGTAAEVTRTAKFSLHLCRPFLRRTADHLFFLFLNFLSQCTNVTFWGEFRL